MARQSQYMQGFREASKLAIAKLHEEAAEMNDPHAKQIADGIAFRLGVHMKQAFKQRQAENPIGWDFE